MNIGIDGYEANTIRRVGIGQYAFQLLKQFHIQDSQNHYTIFLPQQPLPDLPTTRLGWTYKIGRPQSFWTVRQLPALIKQHKLDILFSPTHYIPWFVSLPRLMSVMDLSYLHYPELFRKKDLWQLKYMGRYSIKRARKIFTISQFTKQEIHTYYKYPLDDIVVTYPGISNKFAVGSSQSAVDAVMNKYQINQKYILFVGTIQPRKNITRLVRAFASFKNNFQLVIVGKKGWLYEPILADAQNLIEEGKVLFLDFVPDQELPVLYQNATCFVLPSLYEGFGIPVVEALSYGCPVVISNVSSLPEIAGDLGIYVNPLDIQDIASGITKAVQLTPEARLKYKNDAIKYVEKFSWHECARKTLEVFDQLI